MKSSFGLLDENLCSTLIESIRGIVWEADPLSFRFFFVSPHAETVLGYPLKQWLDEPDFWRTHTHPDDMERCSELCREASLKGEDHDFQYRMIAADGRVVWLHDIVNVARLDDGSVRLRGIMIDITGHKEVEDALRTSEERLRVIFETSHSGIIMVDAEGRITFANGTMAEMLSCPLTEMIGAPYLSFLHQEELNGGDDLMEQLLTSESSHSASEMHFLRCDGSDLWGYVTSTRLENESGQSQGLIAVVSDITDLKGQQLAQKEGTARWQMVMERSRDGIVILDAASCAVRDVNPAFAEMLGYPRDEMLGMRPWDWDLRFTREEIEGKACTHLGGDIFFETRMRRRDGTELDVEVSVTITEYGDERQFFCFVRDITEQKELERALRESGQFFGQIISNTEEGIIVYDRDMRYQVWNPFMERLTGRKASEVIGRRPLECFPSLLETGIMENVRKVLAGEAAISSTEFSRPAQDGQMRWISDTNVPLRNGKGEIIGVIGTVLDVTERRRTEEELKSATQRLQLAVSSGHLGIWDWDTVNDRLVWNERMYELYGVSRESFRMSRETWKECLHPDDVEMALEVMRGALSGTREYDLEFRVVHPDGVTKYIKSNGMVIRDEAGKAVRMIGMNLDITERKQTEEQLRQAQKMEAVGQLAGGVAHDFNNILTAIYGYCSILQMRMGQDSPFRAETDHIYEAAEKAANLTRSLLAFSRKQIMSPKRVNLNEIVLNVGKLLTRIIGEDVQLKTVCTGKPLTVFADSGQIEQVLMNMAANARDAMPGGGILTVETGETDIDEGFIHTYGYGDRGRYVVLTISDTGRGMDAETRKKIFEPFFTTKEVGKGTGLGLSIVYGVIKQHNGFINVYSEPGRGTTFRIYLPQVHGEEAEGEMAAPLEFPRMGNETVLVAEDDAAIRELAETILRQYGYDVILAEDGEDAINKFMANSEKIAIIVMDMIMPKKSGKEAYEEIWKVRPDVKVLFMSGYSPDLLHDRGIFESSEEVLIKPLPPLDLVRKVRAILDRPP